VIVTYVYQLIDGEVSPSAPASRFGPFPITFIRNMATLDRAEQLKLTVQVKVDKVEYRRPDPPREGVTAPQVGALQSPVQVGW
jgi:hypothetical protein